MAKYFEFVKNGETHVFSGKQPRDVALKAATRFGKKGKMDENVELRERGRRNKDGTYTLHQFKIGYEVKSADNAPSWIGSTVKEPKAKKLGVKHVKEIPQP